MAGGGRGTPPSMGVYALKATSDTRNRGKLNREEGRVYVRGVYDVDMKSGIGW